MSQYKSKKSKTWSFDYKSRDGKHITKAGFKTKKEAKEAERVHKLIMVEESHNYFDDAVALKLNQLKVRNQESTHLKDCQLWKNHIQPYFPNKLMSDYSMKDIDNLIRKLNQKGRSNKTINTVVEFISIVFNFGIKREMCYKNPCVSFEKLPVTKKEMVWWTEEQFNSMVNNESDFEYFVLFNTLYWTGMRKGEVQALRWTDINFDKKRISINKHYSTALSKTMKGRKNGNTYSISIDSDLVNNLMKLKEINSHIDGYKNDSYVFGTIRPLPAETIRRKMNRNADAAGIPRMKVHGLRHSHVSYLFNNTSLTVQEIASRISDTTEVVLRTYAHMIKDNDTKVINAIEEAKNKRK